ncbi:MAG: TonB-dependent receptor plug domain-containing protein [Gammaproteobacteria bacterium]|nr:TonB-dependent receptor plug domain-containing protein [Gammaproteobacteria bacterium]
MGTKFNIAALASVMAAAATTPLSAIAQAEEARVLEEVTVTARRREENLQDVPMAVTAISGEELTRAGADDITASRKFTPSVTLEPSRATNTTLTAFIRGVGQQDPLAGFEQGVALYIDDVYIARPQGSLLSIYDVERVEVLRGPQGTLYGRNAVGGAIKYVTKKLSGEHEFRARTQFGQYGQRDVVLTGTMPVTDTLAVGGTVASFNRDGYGDNLTTGAENYDKDIFAYRVSAEWTPSPDVFVRLAYDHTDDDSSPVAGYRPFPGAASGAPVLDDLRDTLAGAADLPTTAGIDGENEIESEGIHFSIDWDITSSLRLRSITADREDLTHSVIDFDSLASPTLMRRSSTTTSSSVRNSSCCSMAID